MTSKRVFSRLMVTFFCCSLALTGNGREITRFGYNHEETQLSSINGVSFLCPQNGIDVLSLNSLRQILENLEDTIIFSLIGRAKFPLNSPSYASSELHPSLVEFLVKGTEALQSQCGRYQSPEEVPFFPDHLPPSFVHPHNCSQELVTSAASVSVNKNVWDSYVNEFVPLLAPKGDDGNYALSVSSDLACLQAISRRIHYGKYVAEAKFRGSTEAYSAAIRAKDRDTLTKLLTDEKVEAMVKERVMKKSTIFGQEITLSDTSNSSNDVTTVDPSTITRLYDEVIIPLTKEIEIKYLLLRLD